MPRGRQQRDISPRSASPQRALRIRHTRRILWRRRSVFAFERRDPPVFTLASIRARPSSWHSTALVLASLAALWLCRGEPPPTPSAPALLLRGFAGNPTGHVLVTARPAEEDPARCESRVQHTRAQPAAPGAALLERNRVALLLRAKAEPLIFVRAPMEDTVSQVARGHRALLERTKHPWEVTRRSLKALAHSPKLARQVFLREGYLYTADPELAFAFSDNVRAEHLFDEPRIWVERGERLRYARRDRRGLYVWEDGPEQGRTVQLLLFDRMGTADAPPPPALHRDTRSLARRLGFDRMSVRHMTEHAMVVDLRYRDLTVPTLLESRGARLELVCETPAPEQRPALEEVRRLEARTTRVVDALRVAMLEQIDDGLPFDEPLTEMGQQDGKLRAGWRLAYQEGRQSYRFDVDRYPVFDARGRPLVPQVCVDFLMDTLTRASGSWWRPLGEPRERTRGLLDFEAYGGDVLRGVWAFLSFAEQRRDMFEDHVIPERERFSIGHRAKLERFLTENADRFRPGDMTFIHGWTPWDEHHRHYHSFFVYESDPVTGVPIAIVGNAGRPAIRPWVTEAVRTPRRQLVRSIRPRLEWLEESVVPSTVRALDEPPPLERAAG